MELAQLYSRGTRLAEVKPDFRGMTWREWQLRKISKAAAEWRLQHAGENPIEHHRVSGARDNYGMQGPGV